MAFVGRGALPQPVANMHHIDWVIAGGESGPGARPMHPDWARSLRDQCEAAGVPFVASPSPEYEWLQAEHGIGQIARSPKQWLRMLDHLGEPEALRQAIPTDALRTLIDKADPDLRARLIFRMTNFIVWPTSASRLV